MGKQDLQLLKGLSTNPEERAEIVFPRTLRLGEITPLVDYLCLGMGCNIQYSVRVNRSASPGNCRTRKSLTSVSLEGSLIGNSNHIELGGKSTRFESFSLDSPAIKGIRFVTIPGYENLDNYSKGEIKIWDDARTLINNYFEGNR